MECCQASLELCNSESVTFGVEPVQTQACNHEYVCPDAFKRLAWMHTCTLIHML